MFWKTGRSHGDWYLNECAGVVSCRAVELSSCVANYVKSKQLKLNATPRQLDGARLRAEGIEVRLRIETAKENVAEVKMRHGMKACLDI